MRSPASIYAEDLIVARQRLAAAARRHPRTGGRNRSADAKRDIKAHRAALIAINVLAKRDNLKPEADDLAKRIAAERMRADRRTGRCLCGCHRRLPPIGRKESVARAALEPPKPRAADNPDGI